MQSGGRGGYENRSNYGSYNSRDSSRESYSSANRDSSGGGGGYRIPAHKMVYDGKRMRKAITRRTVDFNATVLRGLQVIIVNILVKYLILSRLAPHLKEIQEESLELQFNHIPISWLMYKMPS